MKTAQLQQVIDDRTAKYPNEPKTGLNRMVSTSYVETSNDVYEALTLGGALTLWACANDKSRVLNVGSVAGCDTRTESEACESWLARA